jgi:hypothetical protein
MPPSPTLPHFGAAGGALPSLHFGAAPPAAANVSSTVAVAPAAITRKVTPLVGSVHCCPAVSAA